MSHVLPQRTWQAPNVTALNPVATQIRSEAPLPTARPSMAAEGLQRAFKAVFVDLPRHNIIATTPINTTLNPSSSTSGDDVNPASSARGSPVIVPICTPVDDMKTSITLAVKVRNAMAISVTMNGLENSGFSPSFRALDIALIGLLPCRIESTNIPR